MSKCESSESSDPPPSPMHRLHPSSTAELVRPEETPSPAFPLSVCVYPALTSLLLPTSSTVFHNHPRHKAVCTDQRQVKVKRCACKFPAHRSRGQMVRKSVGSGWGATSPSAFVKLLLKLKLRLMVSQAAVKLTGEWMNQVKAATSQASYHSS